MPTINLLYKQRYDITDAIHISIPTVRDVLESEDEYYGAVFALTAMPIDMMVQLDDIGIDFTQINEYELFLYMFPALRVMPHIGLIFGDLDLSGFQTAVDDRGHVFLIDQESDIRIDRAMYGQIAQALREIHGLTKDVRKPGNDEARKYMIDRERKKMRRAARQKKRSYLESLIIALVNTEQFKYDYESILDLTIYQLNASLRQITKKINYDNLMFGCYSGSVDIKKISQEELIWLPT